MPIDPGNLTLARLTRFYGLPPDEFREMPQTMLMDFFKAIQYLEAGEQLDRMETAQFPHLDENSKKAVHRKYRTILDMVAQPEPDFDKITYLKRSMEGKKRKR